ncbi:MAG: UMP kinase [Nanoarchaeota archaeon]|nr:UMP kinase [Nanoarchaeota archaeon]|tara:strand:+ start:2017 stop:2688 length:672 start_codon:yes stop_codon:yes gene_type:complete
MKIVISLGGSKIVPNKVDYYFLKKFKKVVEKIKKGNKIVIVTGGGSTARKYIEALGKEGWGTKSQNALGFNVTRLNALLVSDFLKSNLFFPNSKRELKKMLNKQNIVVTGAVDFKPKMTTDGTSADIAKFIKADVFVNITNVKGLYDKDPKKFKNAKFIPEISFKEFSKIVNKIKFKPGQHFVLDQRAAKVISKNKIKTVITKDINNLIKIVKGEKFIGTTIS